LIDAQQAADRATYGAAIAPRSTGGNALSLHRERRGDQSRNHGNSQFFPVSPFLPRLPG
jgi:hypothetical protein